MDTVRPWELLIIVLAIGLPFGATRLPKMVRSLGRASGSFAASSMTAVNPTPPDAAQEPGNGSPLAAR